MRRFDARAITRQFGLEIRAHPHGIGQPADMIEERHVIRNDDGWCDSL